MKKLLIVLSIITIVGMIMVSGVYAKGNGCNMDARGICVPACTMAQSGNCDCPKTCKMTTTSPSGTNINDTPSIKEMRSKPCPKQCYGGDALGNKVATQTDNSGKNYLGR